MPRKYIIVYDIFGVLVTVHSDLPESGPPVGDSKKKWTLQTETLHGVQMSIL